MGFVLVVGPSGAGKDTLIRLARETLAAEARYLFPRRLVTRPPSTDEDNETVSEEEFARGEAEGRFALSWQAHGLGYGLSAEAGRLAREGRVVVCNVSRRIVEEARKRFEGTRVVEVTAPPDILAKRLAARGRAEDGALSARLARRAPVVPDLILANTGRPQVAAEHLVAFLRDT